MLAENKLPNPYPTVAPDPRTKAKIVKQKPPKAKNASRMKMTFPLIIHLSL
jgi:hypothetical protein